MRIKKSVKICLGVTAILIISITVTIVILWFTLLKPKQPKITTQQVSLEQLNLQLTPLQLDVTLGLLLTIHNPNHASFKYDNTTAHVTYRGSAIAEAAIGQDNIPARADHNITTDVLLNMDSLVTTAGFLEDFVAGCLNFTSATTLHGKAKVLNLFKVKGTTTSTCEISVYILTQNATSVCKSKFKV